MKNVQEKELLTFIKELYAYQQLGSFIKIENGNLIINTTKGIKSYDITKINLKELNNENFQKSLSTMNIDDFSNLVSISTKIEEVAPTKNQEIADNPRIKNFKVLEKKIEDNKTIEYPYYIDENNNVHILFNYAGINILREYQIFSLQKGGIVSEKDLYDHFNRKMKQVELKEDYKLGENIREGAKVEIEELNKQNKKYRVFANAEHGIYKAGENLYTFDTKNGYLKKSNYQLNKNKSEEKQKNEVDFKATNNQEIQKSNVEKMLEEPKEEKEIRLIGEKEYYMLIEYCTPQEKPEITLFESFMEDIMHYKDYVSDTLKNIYKRYTEYMLKLEIAEELSPFLQSALKRYKEMLEKNEEKAYENVNKEEILTRVRKLDDKYQNAGFTSFSIIMIFVSILLILVTIILINMK